MKQNVREHIPYFITVLVIIGPWFFKKGYLFFTDFVWGPHLHSMWYDNWFLVHTFFNTLSFLFPAPFLEKIFIGLVFLLVLLGAKKLITQIIQTYFSSEYKNTWLIFIISLFSVFNPFVYDRALYGQFGVIVSFGLLLFSVGYLLAYVRNYQQKELLWFGVLTGFMILFSPHFFFFFAIITLIILCCMGKARTLLSGSFVRTMIFTVSIIFLINSNWLIGSLRQNSNLPTFLQDGISRIDPILFQTRGETSLGVVTNVVQMSGFWGKDQRRYIDLTKIEKVWGRSFLLLLPLILFGVWVSLRDKKTRWFSVSFMIVYIISFVLAIGIRLPISREITEFLYHYIPFYNGLREPQKWVSVMVLVYIVYISLGSSYLLAKNFVRENRHALGIFLAASIIMQTPFLLLAFHGQVRPVEYPRDWYRAEQVIREDVGFRKNCQEKILVLPWHMYMKFTWTNTIVAHPANQFFTCPVIQGTNMEWGGVYDNSSNKDSEKVSQWIKEKGKTDLLSDNQLNIRYILITKDADWKQYDWVRTVSSADLLFDTEILSVYRLYD